MINVPNISFIVSLAREVLGSFGNDYHLLAACLDIKDNSLIVKNPSTNAKNGNESENVDLNNNDASTSAYL